MYSDRPQSPGLNWGKPEKVRKTKVVVIVVCLQAAGNAVKRATEALVTEAQKVHSWSSSYTHDESSVTVDERMVGSMAQVRQGQLTRIFLVGEFPCVLSNHSVFLCCSLGDRNSSSFNCSQKCI